jgi:hypothetical protein
MKAKWVTTEEILYIIAFAVALGVRLLRLGTAPLSDFEATWALQALDVARGTLSTIGPNPGYIVSGGLIFFIFESNEFFARLLPALAGAGLVWAPYLFRRMLGRNAGVIMAFGLALDPGLVALSRIAGGPILAIGCSLLAIGFWYKKRPVISGIFGALALLGGTTFLLGFLGLLFSLVFAKTLEKFGILDSPEDELIFDRSRSLFVSWLFAFLGTILVFGTLFLLYPQGIGALVESLPIFLYGLFTPSAVPASRLIAALIFYQPLALIFGSIAMVRGWRYRQDLARWLSIWFIIALILPLIYQGRQVWDIAWALIPLWALASIELSRCLRVKSVSKEDRWPMLGEAVLIFILTVIVWLNFASAANVVGNDQVARLRWVVILGAIVLGVITTILVALGWSTKAANRGLVLGIFISLGLYVIASMWSASQVHANGENELWSPPPYTRRMDALVNTMADLSEWDTGFRNTLEIVTVSEAPSLRWALRNWEDIKYSTDTFGDLPPVILKSGEQSAPSQTVAYRGQGFGLWAYPAWNDALPLDWPKWIVFREAPHYSDELILWARGDLFPDGSMLVETDTDPSAPIGEEENFEGLQE